MCCFSEHRLLLKMVNSVLLNQGIELLLILKMNLFMDGPLDSIHKYSHNVLVYTMLFAKAEQAFNFQIIKGNFYLLVKFALYLVCVYWSTQAFIKYQSEPAITTIKYEFDKNQQGHLFPLMTFCKSSPDYPSVFGTECGWIQSDWTCPFPQEFQDTYVGNGNCDSDLGGLHVL